MAMTLLDMQTHSALRRPDPEEAELRLRRRVQFLLPRDRTLVELALGRRATRRQIARLTGLPPGTVSRRLWRLSNLLHDPLIIALLEHAQDLRPEHRQLGIEYWLHNKRLTDLADLHQMPRPEVRRVIEYLRGWHRALAPGRRAGEGVTR